MAGALFGEVEVSLFVANAFFGEVQMSFFVARSQFGEVQVSLFVAGCGLWSDHAQIRSDHGRIGPAL